MHDWKKTTAGRTFCSVRPDAEASSWKVGGLIRRTRYRDRHARHRHDWRRKDGGGDGQTVLGKHETSRG